MGELSVDCLPVDYLLFKWRFDRVKMTLRYDLRVDFGACGGGGVEKNVVGRVVFLLVGRVIMEGNRKSN